MNCENIINKILDLPSKIELRQHEVTEEMMIFTFRNFGDLQPTDYWYVEESVEQTSNKYKQIKLCTFSNKIVIQKYSESKHVRWVM